MKRFFLYVLLTLAIVPMSFAQTPDWNAVAAEVVKGNTNYEKFYSIYRWECENIAYDTDYSIYSAEACYNTKQGVCNGYCELFCRIAEAAGLKARKISGISKKINGKVSRAGHAWIYAYLDPDTDKGILIDPTWGAGTVSTKDGEEVFTRNENNDSWFDVDPYWMIFRHFPKKAEDQFLKEPITEKQFADLPSWNPTMNIISGLNPEEVVKKSLAGEKTELPKFYSDAANTHKVTSLEIPFTNKIYVEDTLTVKVKCPCKPSEISFLGSACRPYNYGKWQREGDYLVGVVTPHQAGKASICIKMINGRSYDTIVSYEVVLKNE